MVLRAYKTGIACFQFDYRLLICDRLLETMIAVSVYSKCAFCLFADGKITSRRRLRRAFELSNNFRLWGG